LPTYEYACRSCGSKLEVVQSFTDDALTTCGECGGPLRKVFGAVGIAFKGSGFYKTDSRKGSSRSSASESSDGASKDGASKDGASKDGASKDGAGEKAPQETKAKEPAAATPAGDGGSTAAAKPASSTTP
jgi:putative FmdB family regulatory protein